MSGPVRSYASGGQWRVLTGAPFNTTAPSPPSVVSVNYADGQLTVVLAPPLSNGGSAITSYTAQAAPQGGGVTQYTTGAGTTQIIENLVPGVTYNIGGYASNAIGDGGLSATQTFVAPALTFVKPQAFNTGYPHSLPGDTRTPAGALTSITGEDLETVIQATAGDVELAEYDVQGPFNLRRNNITFRNCRFNGIPSVTANAGFPYISAGGSPQPTVVNFIDCEFAGNGVPQDDPDGDLTLGWTHSLPCNVLVQNHLRSDIWGFEDGLHILGGKYESCYVHDVTHYYKPTGDGESHNDGFQLVGEADNFTMAGCNIDMAGIFGLSSLFQYNTGSSLSVRTRITLMYNWFAGGGFFAISGVPNAADETLSMVMAHNRFSLQTASLQIWYSDPGWAEAIDLGKLTLINNVWDATGTTSYGDSVVEGELIPDPEP